MGSANKVVVIAIVATVFFEVSHARYLARNVGKRMVVSNGAGGSTSATISANIVGGVRPPPMILPPPLPYISPCQSCSCQMLPPIIYNPPPPPMPVFQDRCSCGPPVVYNPPMPAIFQESIFRGLFDSKAQNAPKSQNAEGRHTEQYARQVNLQNAEHARNAEQLAQQVAQAQHAEPAGSQAHQAQHAELENHFHQNAEKPRNAENHQQKQNAEQAQNAPVQAYDVIKNSPMDAEQGLRDLLAALDAQTPNRQTRESEDYFAA